MRKDAAEPYQHMCDVSEELRQLAVATDRAQASRLTRVAVWGLTFKARTDDMRESPALEVLRRLHERGAVIRA